MGGKQYKNFDSYNITHILALVQVKINLAAQMCYIHFIAAHFYFIIIICK